MQIDTPFGSRTECWDEEKLAKFFESMEGLDLGGLSEFSDSKVLMKLTMASGETNTIDARGQRVVTTIEEAMEALYEENFDESYFLYYDRYIGEGDGDGGDDGSGDGDGGSGGGGGDDGGDGGDGDSGYIEPEPGQVNCDNYEIINGRKLIISHVVCGVEEE